MTINWDDDPINYLKAIGELLITLLSMHMTPEMLRQTAGVFRALADQQEATTSLGVAVHPANKIHDPKLMRLYAAFYQSAETVALERLSSVPIPQPGHEHGVKDGLATAPEDLTGLR